MNTDPPDDKMPSYENELRPTQVDVVFRRKARRSIEVRRYDSSQGQRDKSVLKYRLSGRQMSRLFSDPEISGEPPAADGDPDFTCSAGRNMVTIGFDGEVYPCFSCGRLWERRNRFSRKFGAMEPGLSAFRKLSIKDFQNASTATSR